VEKGRYEEAVNEFQKMGDHPYALGHMGNAYARAGRVAEARETISKLKERVRKDNVGTYEIALVYAGLGEKDAAFAWLEKAHQVRDKGLTFLKVDPSLDPLRSDPAFKTCCAASACHPRAEPGSADRPSADGPAAFHSGFTTSRGPHRRRSALPGYPEPRIRALISRR
jgi:tetratricopeptide (TPR) repeat protein